MAPEHAQAPTQPASSPLAPLDWRAQDLWLKAVALLPGLTVEVLAEVDSTNTALLARARSGDAGPCLLVAEHQTAGRGRQGRVWQSAPGASLTFSLGLPLAPADWSGLSLAVGLALAEALDPANDRSAPRLGLKWPNDLLLIDAAGQRKTAGILVETVTLPGAASAGPGNPRFAVIGVGLNILPRDTPDPDGPPLSNGYACLSELDPAIDAPSALARVAPALLRAVLDFARSGFAPLQARYAARDVLAGRAVSTVSTRSASQTSDRANGVATGVADGVADGVDERGVLWLRVGAQRLPVASGEVSVRAAASGQSAPVPSADSVPAP